jgi:LysR family nitrogen assimilation transcriptional regulator
MDFKKLRAFALIAKYKSFSKTAIHLSVSQSLLSKYIGELENELNVRLFYRNGRGALLTAEGEELLNYAERFENLIEETVTAVRGLKATPSGEVTIGTSSAVGATLTVPLIMAAKQRYPLVKINIFEALSGHVHEWLNTGLIDMAVTFDTEGSPSLRHEDLVLEDLLLVSAPDAIGMSGEIPAQELHKLELVLPSRAHKLRILIDAYTEALGFHFRPNAEIDGLFPMIEAVRCGLGHTILPFGAIRHEAAVGRVRLSRIVSPALRRNVILSTSVDRVPSTANSVMADLIRSEVIALDKLGFWRPSDEMLRFADTVQLQQHYR